jgi:hypothetical protein
LKSACLKGKSKVSLFGVSVKKRITLSLVLCSRNDSYMGNSLWRLQTALNYLADQIPAGRESQIEVIVSDWGSEVPLRKAIQLKGRAARVTSFLEIPPHIAENEQKDSPFPEVLALNAAIRRSHGEFIGRVDQDILIKRRFFDDFFAIYEGKRHIDFPLMKSYLFAERYSIPYNLASRSFPLRTVKRFIKIFNRCLPMDGPHIIPWFDVPVGIMLLHSSLFEEIRGYDETLLYWGWMETDLAYRIMQKYELMSLRSIIKRAFFHLEHNKWRTPNIHRRQNPRKKNLVLAPNATNWGLIKYDLPLRKYIGTTNSSKNLEFKHLSWSKDFVPIIWGCMGLPKLWARYILLKCYRYIRLLNNIVVKRSDRKATSRA